MFPPLTDLAEALFWIMAVIAGVIIVIVGILDSSGAQAADEEIANHTGNRRNGTMPNARAYGSFLRKRGRRSLQPNGPSLMF
jgi:hypothetical protein